MVSGDNSTTCFLFEVLKGPQSNCNKPDDSYPPNCNSLYVLIHMGGFDMCSGSEHLMFKQNTYSTTNPVMAHTMDAFLSSVVLTVSCLPSLTTWIMDYELRQGTKLDYLFFESTSLLEASEFQLLKAQYNQERTQFLTAPMRLLENPRLTGYTLTANRFMFLSTADGSLA